LELLLSVLRLALTEPLLLSCFSSGGGTVRVLGVLLREDRLLLRFLSSRILPAAAAAAACLNWA